MLNSVGLAPLCLRRSQIFPRGYFAGPKFFYHVYFVGPKVFFVGILRFPNFFSWVFCGFKIYCRGVTFSHEYFEDLEFFLVASLFSIRTVHTTIFFSLILLTWSLLMALNILDKLRKTDQTKKLS